MNEVRNTVLEVFPTHVGVNQDGFVTVIAAQSIPHACGGEPGMSQLKSLFREYSPRMWG